MMPLREIPRVRQAPNDPFKRRWLTCESADLFVWEDEDNIASIEFCYGKPLAERSVSWSRTGGFKHARIDDGESHAMEHRSPIARPDRGVIDLAAVALELEKVGALIDPPTCRAVLRILHLGR